MKKLPDWFKVVKAFPFAKVGDRLNIGVDPHGRHCISIGTEVIVKQSKKRTAYYTYNIPVAVAFEMKEYVEPIYDGSFWDED